MINRNKIFLGLIIIVLLLGISFYSKAPMDFNDVEFSFKEYQEANKIFKNDLSYKVCSLENNNCNIFTNINNYKKVMGNG